MKKIFGILMLVVTLLSGIVVMAQNSNSSTTRPNSMGQGHGGRRHRRHQRWHRRHRRHGKHTPDKH